MPDINGMAAAKRIRAMDQRVLLIFVTSLTQYAIEGYEVNALDYIVKPVKYPSFAMKLAKALWRVDQSGEDFLTIASGSSTSRVILRDVIYIEVQDHLLTYYTLDGTYSEFGTLGKLEKALSEKGFARCSSCYLVNLKHVRGLKGYSLYMDNGTELRISQPKKKSFSAAFSHWEGGDLTLLS